MATVVFNASADLNAKFAGGLSSPGISLDAIYDQNTGVQTNFGPGNDALKFIGNATGSAFGVTGIYGGTGNDVLIGLAGDDVFHGSTGANKIDGGDGNDTAGFDFSDQLGDVKLVNRGVPGVKYHITSGGAAYGWVRNIEATGDLKGGAGNDRIGGVYT
ncbi:MAG: hypothetical protein NT133_01610, partial [Alphaproteobacteria bacterium]|nr:hypothetical protein [Alphaproteobacteria bacterium]